MEKKRRPSKEVPAGEALRASTSFDYFICNIPVVICKLDLVFCFYQIVNRQLKKSSPWQGLEPRLLRPHRQVIYIRKLLAHCFDCVQKSNLIT